MKRELQLSHWIMPGLSYLAFIQNDEQKIKQISHIVALHFNLTIVDILGKSRRRELVDARSIIMYFAFKKTKLSLSAIGRFFNKNHSTVIYSRNNAENLMFSDKEFNKNVIEIARLL